MNVGDRIRLAPKPACQDLGVPRDQVGVVKDVDASCDRTTVLISFPDVDVYTSALHDDDVEVIPREAQLAKGLTRRDR